MGELDQAMARMLPLQTLRQAESQLHEKFQTARPFRFVGMDGLFDEAVLDRLVREFPKPEGRDWIVWKTDREYKATSRGLEGISPFSQLFLLMLNTTPFIDMVKAITGFDDLVPDPTYFGAGLQETLPGGWLDIHSDYTKHPHMPLARRLNLLIYLNRDWDPAWGGDLELWDQQGPRLASRIVPLFNRTVLFETTPQALHGHPRRLQCPPDRTRKMVSVYYWSAAPEALAAAQPLRWVTRSA